MVMRDRLSQLLEQYDSDVRYVIANVVRLEQEHIHLELQQVRLREPIVKVIDDAIRRYPAQTEGHTDEA